MIPTSLSVSTQWALSPSPSPIAGNPGGKPLFEFLDPGILAKDSESIARLEDHVRSGNERRRSPADDRDQAALRESELANLQGRSWRFR